MVNYDLPWNPNRLEQRFGRIHRIGQTEVCHLWNLVAARDPRGRRLRAAAREARRRAEALGGQVFDVLGRADLRRPSRCASCSSRRSATATRPRSGPEIDAGHRRGARPRPPARAAGRAGARRRCARLRARSRPSARRWSGPRRDRLQPHYIRSFFLEAFRRLGGTGPRARAGPVRGHPRPGPHPRPGARGRACARAVLGAYERVTFDKDLISPGPAAGRVRLPRPPAARGDDRPPPRAASRPPPPGRGAR